MEVVKSGQILYWRPTKMSWKEHLDKGSKKRRGTEGNFEIIVQNNLDG